MHVKQYSLICFLISIVVMTIQGNITEEELNTIFQQHCLTLKNITIKNDPTLIAFSATPGMGKTFIAKKLEDYYHAIRISTDVLRKIIESNSSVSLQEYENVLHQYLLYFFKHYNQPNKRFILDASIDRKYIQVVPFCKQHKINVIIIRLEVPKDIVINRLQEREGIKASWYLKNLNQWLADYYNFADNYKNYISYTNSENSDFDLLIKKVNEKML